MGRRPTDEDFDLNYELLDFGRGRKLERFGDRCLDRPCPAAEGDWAQPELWSRADWEFRKSGPRGRWLRRSRGNQPSVAPINDPVWPLDCGPFRLKLRRTSFGHVGVFPEQTPNWRQIAKLVRRRGSQSGPSVRVLNLFAYTGASSLAAAAAGASVVHIDSARTTVQRARENAAFSGLESASIRWIVEDARRFVAREVRRENRYEAIILDPPSYGHGTTSEAWKLTTDLMPLLEQCKKLLSSEPSFVLLTCHSPGFGPAELGATLQQAIFGHCQGRTTTYPLELRTRQGRRLSAGVAALATFS